MGNVQDKPIGLRLECLLRPNNPLSSPLPIQLRCSFHLPVSLSEKEKKASPSSGEVREEEGRARNLWREEVNY